MNTDIKPIRQQRLKEWFSERPIPREESSYISQLINGRSAFGHRTARRLENDYGMPKGFLDEPFNDESPSPQMANLDFRKLRLLELADELPDPEVDEIIKVMEQKAKFYQDAVKEFLIKRGIDPDSFELKKT